MLKESFAPRTSTLNPTGTPVLPGRITRLEDAEEPKILTGFHPRPSDKLRCALSQGLCRTSEMDRMIDMMPSVGELLAQKTSHTAVGSWVIH